MARNSYIDPTVWEMIGGLPKKIKKVAKEVVKVSTKESFEGAAKLILSEPNTKATEFLYGKEKLIDTVEDFYVYTTPKGTFKGRENKFIVNKWKREDGVIRYTVHQINPKTGMQYPQVSSAVQFEVKSGKAKLLTIASEEEGIGLGKRLLAEVEKDYGKFTYGEPVSKQGAKLLESYYKTSGVVAEDWAKTKLSSIDPKVVPGWGRAVTKEELSKLAKDYSLIPPEIRKFAEELDRDIKVIAIKKDLGFLPYASGNEIALSESSLRVGGYSKINQHELRHAMVSDRIIKINGGYNNMWEEIDQLRKPIHVNSMYSKGGNSVNSAIDEFITMLGDNYESGMSVSKFAEKLLENIDVEPRLNSGQVIYYGMEKWSKAEAMEAAKLWFKWFRI